MNKVEITETDCESLDGVRIVHILLRDTLTEERCKFVKSNLEELVSKHGRIRILLLIEKRDGITLESSLDLLDLEGKHSRDIEKVAVILTDDDPISANKMKAAIGGLKTEFFDADKQEDAWKWLKES